MCDTANVSSSDRESGTWIGHTVERDQLRSKQILQRGGANGAVVTTAEADVTDRSEFPFDLVGVGLERCTTIHAVRRMAITTGEGQVIEDSVLDQRCAQLGEDFLHVELTAHRRRCAALTSEIASRERNVGHKVERFLAVFNTDSQSEAVLGHRALDAIGPQITGQRAADDLFGVDTLGNAGNLDIVQRCLSDSSGAEDVPGNAVWISPIKHRTANCIAIAIFDHVDRAGDPRDREVVLVDLGVVGAAILIVGIIRPGIAEIALHPENAAIRRVLQIADAAPAFDVTTQDLRETTIVAVAQRVSEDVWSRAWIVTDDIKRAGWIDQQVFVVADHGQLRSAQ